MEDSEKTDFDKFLEAKPEVGTFGETALKAAVEIVKEIAKEEGKNPAYHRVDEEPGWIKWGRTDELRDNLNAVVNNWNNQKRGIFFRGSKMPNPSMGSFGFAEKGVHVAPLLGTAQGYAASINRDTGVGRLLNYGDERRSASLGFLSTWEMSLDENMWRNFQYETFEKNKKDPSQVTIKDLMEAIKNIAQLDKSAFEPKKTPDGELLYNEAEEKFRELFDDHNFYEAITKPGTQPQKIFLQIADGQKNKLLAINPEHPKWDQWMARVQEANLRDFYQLKPLQQTISSIQAYIRITSENDHPNEIKTAAAIIQEAQRELDKAMQEPWKCQSMKEAMQLEANLPWVRESVRVGSVTDGTPNYPPNIQRIVDAANFVQCGRHTEAIEKLYPAAKIEGYKAKRGDYGTLDPADLTKTIPEQMLGARKLGSKHQTFHPA